MSVDDYFTRNMYKGKIYKTSNMLGKTLAQYCPTDSAMSKEQKRIEGELKEFEKNIWGDPVRKDSLDSIAKLDKKELKAVKKKNRRSGGTSKTVKKKSRTSSGSSSSSSSARVTVRRQRR
jgi:septal ring factor EnvC (AmiA/AmiB activator)